MNKYFCYAFSDHLFVNYQSKESCDIQDSLAAAKAQKDACKASISLCKVNAVSNICFAFGLKLIKENSLCVCVCVCNLFDDKYSKSMAPCFFTNVVIRSNVSRVII